MDDVCLIKKTKKGLQERRKLAVPKINIYDQGMSTLLGNLGMGMAELDELGQVSYFLSVLYQPLRHNP